MNTGDTFYRFLKTIIVSILIFAIIWITYGLFFYILALLIIIIIFLFSFSLVKKFELTPEDKIMKYLIDITTIMEKFEIDIGQNDKFLNNYRFVSLVYANFRINKRIRITDEYINQINILEQKHKKLFSTKNSNLNDLREKFINVFIIYKDLYVKYNQFYKYALSISDYIS
jgi:uncharacterized membrane protein YhiD involved in acid resistance